MSVLIHTYIITDRQTDRHTHTYRQTDRHIFNACEGRSCLHTYLSRRLLLISHCRRLGREHVLQRGEKREGTYT